MERSTQIAAICFMVGIAIASAFGQVSASSIEEIIPSILVVPEGNDVQQVLFGVGVQIYRYNGSAWVQKNVSADLYNFKGLKIGRHFFLGEKDCNGGQPSWETFYPASRVTVKAIFQVNQTADSVPWLLLQATTNTGSRKAFGSVTTVQRLYTHRGKFPPPSYPAVVGQKYESHYTAVYTFSKKSSKA